MKRAEPKGSALFSGCRALVEMGGEFHGFMQNPNYLDHLITTLPIEKDMAGFQYPGLAAAEDQVKTSETRSDLFSCLTTCSLRIITDGMQSRL